MSDFIDSPRSVVEVGGPAKMCGDDLNRLMVRLGGQVSVPPKLYRIGEVVEHSGLSRQTIHNYTTMGLLREADWTRTGHRLYGAEVFRYLAVIRYLLENKYSLSQIKEMFDQIPES